MKKVLVLLALCAFAFSCTQNTFKINGTVDYDDCDGAMALFYYNGVSDTTYVKGNTFSFSRDFVEPEVSIIVIRNESMRNMYCYFVVEPCELNVNISDKSSCTGGKLNDACNAYQLRRRDRADERRADLKAIKDNTDLSEEEKAAAKEQIMESYYEWTAQLDSEIFTNHNNDILGSDAMMSLSRYDREAFDSLYAIAGENIKNSREVVKEAERYKSLDATSEGKMFTDFTVPNGTVDGNSVSLSDYVGKGQYVLVDFWASWCAPCRAAMPYIAAAYEKYKSDKFEVLGVAVWDKRPDTEKAIPTLPISWPIIYDAQKEPTNIYGIYGIPHLILFGPDGTILARDIEDKDIEATLEKFLK